VATSAESGTATAVASVARLIARAGLVEAFGHVSAREGEEMVITSTAPLAVSAASSTHRLPIAAGGSPGSNDETVPLEWPLHAAIYRAREDVGAICRIHPRAAVALGTRGLSPRLIHGLGGLAGEIVLADSVQLVTAEPAADLLAAALGGANCALIRGNGALATGSGLEQAAVRAWFLEERCRIALQAGPEAIELSGSEAAQRRVWHEAEAARAWRWLEVEFAEPGRNRPLPGDDGASAPEGETR